MGETTVVGKQNKRFRGLSTNRDDDFLIVVPTRAQLEEGRRRREKIAVRKSLPFIGEGSLLFLLNQEELTLPQFLLKELTLGVVGWNPCPGANGKSMNP
jgi:hypothetical protein